MIWKRKERMTKHITRLVLLTISLSLLFAQSGTAPAQANAAWTPGFYTGWVSFFARIDTQAQSKNMDIFLIEKFNGRGQLMLKIDDQNQAFATLVLPTDIQILDYAAINTSNGNCTFSSYAIAQTNYVRLHTPVDVNAAFQVPIALASAIRFNKTNAASFGNLPGCGGAGDKNLEAMQKAMQVTTAEMQQMQFTVQFNDSQSIGGSCSIINWEKTTPISGGQGIRSLPRCAWRVFKVAATNGTAEWTK